MGRSGCCGWLSLLEMGLLRLRLLLEWRLVLLLGLLPLMELQLEQQLERQLEQQRELGQWLRYRLELRLSSSLN